MKKLVVILSILFVAIVAVAQNVTAAGKQPVFGKTLDEIIALAKKETQGGKEKVRHASAYCPGEEFKKRFVKPFVDKYGIDVKYTWIHGTESREKILLELKSGEVNYDLLHVAPATIPDMYKADQIAGPFDWRGIFGIDPVFVSSDKNMITAGSTVFGFAYNPDLVPKERIPRKWTDILDPYWKGKFIVVTRPMAFAPQYGIWGKKKTLDYCRVVAAQNPIWISSFNTAGAMCAAGEVPLIWGANTSDTWNQLDLDPTAKIRIALPEDEVFPTSYFHTAILKQAKYPNAALLLAGWFASSEGQKQFDKIIHRGYVLQEGTEINKILKTLGAKVHYRGWDWKPEDESRESKEIVEAWGFPVPRK